MRKVRKVGTALFRTFWLFRRAGTHAIAQSLELNKPETRSIVAPVPLPLLFSSLRFTLFSPVSSRVYAHHNIPVFMRVTFYAIWYNLPVYYTFPALGKALTGSICPSFEYFLPVRVFTNSNTQRPVFSIGQISLGVWFAIGTLRRKCGWFACIIKRWETILSRSWGISRIWNRVGTIGKLISLWLEPFNVSVYQREAD